MASIKELVKNQKKIQILVLSSLLLSLSSFLSLFLEETKGIEVEEKEIIDTQPQEVF